MEWVIFLVGSFVTLLAFGGLALTVLEFRQMDREPERYLPRKNTWSEPNKKPSRAT